MSEPVEGIYGGSASKKSDDVVFNFLDGIPKAANTGAVKASLEDLRSIVAEGMTILPDRNITHVYYGKQTLVFDTDELLLMLK